MYVSKISMRNFRNFKDCKIELNDGINVIIGPNNSGKTNFLKAISLILDSSQIKRLGVEDFNKFITLESLKQSPPSITISATINPGQEQGTDDLVMVSHWLTKLDSSYEALLTYEFFLPEEHKQDYHQVVSQLSESDPKSLEKAWSIIQHDFIRLYKHKVWGGNPQLRSIADAESLSKFDFQFLSAIRDVERDMLTGRNTLLREVIDFFMDHEIKSDKEKTKVEKQAEIKARKLEFSESATALVEQLQNRMAIGKNQILSYAKDIGAAFNNANPSFEGSLSDVEMYSTLQLIVEHETGIKIPATHNGLGYNNLIFMSLLLAKMQVNSDHEYLGGNAKNFSTLAIEEPEAHLHTAMQFKLLKFLRENRRNRKVRQVFVTTHSTHITSAVSLDEIICLHGEGNSASIGYPGRVFPDTKSKMYVQRFLDSTKSDMLFARRVILVEGLAEQLLLPVLAKYTGISLEDHHVAVINVGGRYFNHFLHLFTKGDYSLPKKIACLTDRDPERKHIGGTRYQACYPFQFKQHDVYTYRDNPSTNFSTFEPSTNIRFFCESEDKGKTLEYDIVFHNPTLELLITDSMINQAEIKQLMQSYDDKCLEDLLAILRYGAEYCMEIRQGVNNCNWDSQAERKAAVIAARYLNSVSKGENALELSYALEENFRKKGEESYRDFTVMPSLKALFNWIIE